eukprot:3068510-Alexandrium_andersonii.AAC.1
MPPSSAAPGFKTMAVWVLGQCYTKCPPRKQTLPLVDLRALTRPAISVSANTDRPASAPCHGEQLTPRGQCG